MPFCSLTLNFISIRQLVPRIIIPAYIWTILPSPNTYLWPASLNSVIDADILPLLNEGTYPLGYPYTQADYLHQPNVDYTADLSPAGDLLCTFNMPGLYHIRVTRGSGVITTYAVFAEAGLLEKEKSTKTGKTKKIPCPDGDIFLAENSDDTVDNAAKILENGGKEVKRVDDRKEVVEAIKKKSQALGRKIHAEIVGHGVSGNVSTGAGKKNIPDKQIDLNSVEKFQKEIDDYVDHITFQACEVGKGADGQKFLKILSDSIGKAGAYDHPLIVVNQSHFAVPVGTTWVEKSTLGKEAAHNMDPTHANIAMETPITWEGGSSVDEYQVYMSTDENAVETRAPSALVYTGMMTYYEPISPVLGETYFYTVDTTIGVDIFPGDLWSYTVQEDITLDDFEGYETSDQLEPMFFTSPNSQLSVSMDPAVAEQRCLRADCYNDMAEPVTHISYQVSGDLTYGDTDTLSMRLSSENLDEQALVILQISDTHGSSAALPINAFDILNHPVDEGLVLEVPFVDMPAVDFANVLEIALIVENNMSPCLATGCEQTLFIDDIKTIVASDLPPCVADLDGNHTVDILDFAIMASEWLNPCP